MKKNIQVGIVGGIVLSVPLIYISFLPYLNLQTILAPLIFLGCVIVAFVLLYKNISSMNSLVRSVIMFVCCFLTIRGTAIIGILEKIGKILYIHENETNERVAGLGILFFLIATLTVCTAISITLMIINIIKKARDN